MKIGLKQILKYFFPNTIPRIFLLIAIVMFLGGVFVFMFEQRYNSGEFPDLWNSIWWALVTMTTVGYGDKTPLTWGGRLIAASIMFAGISLVSLLTATISSAFVAKRIREDKGLEQIEFKDHIVICGWNDKTETLIDSIIELAEEEPRIVLVNNLPDEFIKEILFRYASGNIRYVRGDFTRESILEKANIRFASKVIVLPNLVSTDSQDADEKTVLATLSIRSLNSTARLIAFIMNRENRPHLIRAKADVVIISDEYTSYMIASHTFMPGVPHALSDLLKYATGHRFEEQSIPKEFVGKPYAELAAYFKKKNCILIGLSTKTKSIAIRDFLAADTSAIDAFIERKLREAGKSIEKEPEIEVNINPDDGYIIRTGENALLIR